MKINLKTSISMIIIMSLASSLFLFSASGQAEKMNTTEDIADLNYLISDFELPEDKWSYVFGDQPSVRGSFEVMETEEAFTGSHAARLNADFSQSSRDKPEFVAMRKNVDDLDLEQYAFWVKTSDLRAVRIRSIDSTGQTFQQRIELQNTSDWQLVFISDPASGQYWNGAADGAWHAPARSIAIMIDRNDIKNGALTASMLVDQVTAQLGDWQPELKIRQTKLGNVYLDSEPVKFNLSTKYRQVQWQVYDLYGQLIDEGLAQTPDGADSIELSDSKPGYYTLHLTVQREGEPPLLLQTPFAVLSDYDWDQVSDSPFGIAAHLHRNTMGWSAELTKLIRYAGAKIARGGMEWTIEKSPGEYTFTPEPDHFMSYVEAEGLKGMFVSGYNNPFYDNNATPYTDHGREGFANYVNAYVNRYKDQLMGVQVYNEFNGGFGKRGNSPANSQPEYYYQLLKKTYETLKANHPEFAVSGIVSAGVALEWMEEVFELGGMNYLDNIAVHPYRYGRAQPEERLPEGMADELEALKVLIREYNEGELKPIWISEFGWPTHRSSVGVDEKTQADYLVRAYVIALAQGVEKIIWYNLMNDGLQADYNEHNFGLIRFKEDPLGAYTPKPAYVSYAAMTRQLTDAEFVEEEDYGGSIQSFLFDKDGEEVRSVWSLNDTNAAVYTGEPLAITDINGYTETFSPHDGKVYLTLNGEPLFMQGNIDKIEEDATFAISGEDTFVGEEAAITVALRNREADREVTFTLEVEGASYTLSADAGGASQERLMLSPARGNAFRSAVISVMDGDRQIGRLRHNITAMTSHEVKVRPTMTPAEGGQFNQSLDIEIENFSRTKGLTVTGASWSLGGQSGRQLWEEVVQPQQTERFTIPLETMPLGADLAASVQVSFEEALPIEYEGSISFNPITYGNIEVDGVIAPEIDAVAPTIDLAQGKQVVLPGHSGSIDATGPLWLHYDEDYFYLTAKVKEYNHAVPARGADIWNNDSIQFAITQGIPGESQGWYEYGVSDTPDGPQVYRWSTLGDNLPGAVNNAKAEIARDEEHKLTIYELAIPWSELEPIKPYGGEAISFSLLVNDNDGNGRRGWIEWASGIGLEKRATLFRSMQWIEQ